MVIFAVLIIMIVQYSNTHGDIMKQYNERFNRWLLDNGQKIINYNFLFEDREIAKYLPDNFGYAKTLENMNAFMEHATHVIVFFIFTLGYLCVTKKVFPSLWTGILTGIIIATALNLWSEMFQNGISGRGYETIDVINNFIGILAGIIVYIIFVLLKDRISKRRNRKPKRYTVNVRYLNGRPFFK